LSSALLTRADLSEEWRLVPGERGDDVICGETVDNGQPAESAHVMFQRVDVDIVINQDVRRYDDGDAEAFMQRLRDRAAQCDTWMSQQGALQVAWTKTPLPDVQAGDEVVAFHLSAQAEGVSPFNTDSVFIRRGDNISSFVYGGYFSGGVGGTDALDQLVAAADRKLAELD
jgi:hypothetical protein